MDRSFKVAAAVEDFELCFKLMEAQGLSHTELQVPTVMAFEDSEFIGFLGTHYQDELVIAGPLVLKDAEHPRVHAAYMLCELYETAMRSLGVTSYIMHVEDGNFMDQAIKRYNPPGLEQYAREGSRTFYIRRL